MMRAFLIVILLLLTGCGVPPVVTVASLVADAASYAATGKSTSDHAISAIAREDCALIRVMNNLPICEPNGEPSMKVSSDQQLNPDEIDLVLDQLQ